MKTNYDNIDSANELKKLDITELPALAQSLRNDIIHYTSVNGGHIGASLGCVDFIIALHKVFETPNDSFVFDVGHQAYAHKMLTKRRKLFSGLRKEKGLSGFTNRYESKHDIFGAGHASTSISSALGILAGKKHQNDSSSVVAIIGDGALTGGLAFEGLNQAGDLQKNLIIVLNDNQMSIDPNTGALKDTFAKDTNGAKNFFTNFGLDYWGPIDGHDITKLVQVFNDAKQHNKPLVIHLMTEKGRGYDPAITDKIRFHGCGPFEIEDGKAISTPQAKKKYQDLFTETLIELANNDPEVLALTAAMPSGTSLKKFKIAHPTRFYDTGIAEAHTLEFAAGLATQGLKPFACVYSTFLQRAYDQLIHDIAIQNLPVRICMDRGGLVGDDGATHQGVFDYAYLRSIPNFVVMAPKDEAELQNMLETMRNYNDGPISVRFPRGSIQGKDLSTKFQSLPIGKAERLYGETSGDVLICAIGEPVWSAVKAAQELEENYDIKATVLNLRFAKPLDEDQILDLVPQFSSVITVEEGAKKGGVGSAILELFAENRITKPTEVLGIPDRFIEQASQPRQREICQIDTNSIIETAKNLVAETQESDIKKVSSSPTLVANLTAS